MGIDVSLRRNVLLPPKPEFTPYPKRTNLSFSSSTISTTINRHQWKDGVEIDLAIFCFCRPPKRWVPGLPVSGGRFWASGLFSAVGRGQRGRPGRDD